MLMIIGRLLAPLNVKSLNAHAERFVRSINEECLDRIVPLGELHLRRLVREYSAHHHAERNHQGIGNALIDRPPPQPAAGPFDAVNGSAGSSATTIAPHRTARPSLGQYGKLITASALTRFEVSSPMRRDAPRSVDSHQCNA